MKDRLQRLLAPFGQEHLLAHWERLSPSERVRLAEQIDQLDLPRIQRLLSDRVEEVNWSELAERALPPTAFRLHGEGNPFPRSEAIAAGRAALSAGEVGVAIVAGGQGTRLGFDHPKGMFSIGPVSGASLFQILLEKVWATGRRYGPTPPLWIMTSAATHDETAAYLEANRHFGLPKSGVHLFCQGQMPAVEIASGRVLLAGPDEIALTPDGHGGMLAALDRAGGLAELRSSGVKHLFYLQVDNPLVSVCDPEFLGIHVLSQSELSTQAVAKQHALERVGNLAMVDGKSVIIEYSDLPEEVAQKRAPDGSLVLWAGNTGVHAFDMEFLARMGAAADALPFHRAKKKVSHIDAAGGRVELEAPNAIKFERFIFDLLPHARNAVVMEVDGRETFAPVKNAPGEASDTPQTVQAQMIALHTRWLSQVGVAVAEGVAVEISPRFALDDEGVLERMLAGQIEPGEKIETARYFESSS